MSKRLLLASVHDVSPRFESEVDELLARLEPHVGCRIALLVVPNHWGTAPICAATPFAARLRGWADSGMEIFLHGWFHRDLSAHGDLATRMRAEHLTAGEGEFLGLNCATASRRMRDGRSLLEDIIGQPIAGFIAPAWLYSAGAHEALSQTNMALAEDHVRVWSPRDGRVLAKSPVVTWASRSKPRLWSSLIFAAAARNVPMPATMRVGVHPPDLSVPAIMRSIDATLAQLGKSRRPGHYSELLLG